MKKIKNLFSNMLGKNRNITQKPLTGLSIFFVIIFDLFLFGNIFDGYVYQGNLVKSPQELHQCNNLFTNNNLSHQQYIQELYSYENKYKKYQDSQYCSHIDQYLTGDFISLLKQTNTKINDLDREYRNLGYDIDSYKNEYDLYLDEKSSGINDSNDRISDITGGNARAEFESLEKQRADIQQQKLNTINSFIANQGFQSIKKYIADNKDEFNKQYEKEQFWYPVKVGFFQLVLIAPLFIISLFLYRSSLKRRNKIFTILFANLTFITGIFAFILLFKVLYFFLPKKFFIGLIATLKQLNLGFLWNYISVFLGVIIFGTIVYFSQKGSEKLQKIREENEKRRIAENKVKISKERYFKNLCIDCGKTLLKDSKHCSHCGTNQYHNCENCNHEFPKAFEYCDKCGTKK